AGFVLEIGPGEAPTSQANVYLDISYEYLRGIESRRVVGNAIYLPFKDNTFDYCICMHVPEHLRADELPQFFEKISRVSTKGYLEVPAIYFELLDNGDEEFTDFGRIPEEYDSHQSYCFYDGNTLHVIMKSNRGTREKAILRTLFHLVLNPIVVSNNIDLFMIGFEWKKKINFKIYDSLESIPNELFGEILQRVREYANSKRINGNTKKVLPKVITTYYCKSLENY
ncbi:MAG: class I SAM-dependent methyltransferase, partial [Bacteroidetes bacterium]|nr:class I SAM-dependent methyltransferase [Bacteroidota bacterium]